MATAVATASSTQVADGGRDGDERAGRDESARAMRRAALSNNVILWTPHTNVPECLLDVPPGSRDSGGVGRDIPNLRQVLLRAGLRVAAYSLVSGMVWDIHVKPRGSAR